MPPKYIDIELNTSCNLNCSFCPAKEEHKNPQHMDIELYKKIIDQIDWGCSVKLAQRGEPLMSPILIDAIKIAKDKGLRVCFNTNGLLQAAATEYLVGSGIDEIYLSDYGYPKQLANGKYFGKRRGDTIFTVKTDRPFVWLGCADNSYSPLYYDYSDTTEDSTELPGWRCQEIFDKMIIDPDGRVRCCCGNAHTDKYMGDVTKSGLLDIFNSAQWRIYREIHSEGKSHALRMCRECGYRKHIIKTTNQ